MGRSLLVGTVGTSSIMKIIQESLRLTDGMKVQVIYSRDEARGKAFAEAEGVPEHVCDYEEMISRPDLNVIYVASPNKLHTEQVLAALRHGKHVIVEKPAAVTREEVEIMYQTAKEYGVFFFEAITTIQMPNFKYLKEHVKELGTLKKVRFSYGQYSSKYDAYLRGENPNIFNPALQGGALNDMGIYCIHSVINLFGDPVSVKYEAEYGPNGVDLSGTLQMEYPDLTCQVETSKTGPIGSGCMVEGEHGFFEEDGPMCDFANCRISLDGKEEKVDLQKAPNRMMYEHARFRDAILNHDTEFFEYMANQSKLAAGVLERARK